MQQFIFDVACFASLVFVIVWFFPDRAATVLAQLSHAPSEVGAGVMRMSQRSRESYFLRFPQLML